MGKTCFFFFFFFWTLSIYLYSLAIMIYAMESFIKDTEGHFYKAICTNQVFFMSLTRRKKSSYSKLFWSAFFTDFPAFGLNTDSVFSPTAGKSGKYAEKNNSGYGLFLRSLSQRMLCTELLTKPATEFWTQNSRLWDIW